MIPGFQGAIPGFQSAIPVLLKKRGKFEPSKDRVVVLILLANSTLNSDMRGLVICSLLYFGIFNSLDFKHQLHRSKLARAPDWPILFTSRPTHNIFAFNEANRGKISKEKKAESCCCCSRRAREHCKLLRDLKVGKKRGAAAVVTLKNAETWEERFCCVVAWLSWQKYALLGV